MKLPLKFRQIHTDAIFSAWMRCGQAPYVRIIPEEPLGRPLGLSDTVPETAITIVTVRCWNDRGVMKFEAASPADLRVAQEWSERHRDTSPADFRWLPNLTEAAPTPPDTPST